MTKRVLIMAAGTGGHVFPALAVAKTLKDNGIHVAWLGARQGMEVKWVTTENIPIFPIDIGGLRGKGMLSWFTAPFKLLRAFIQSKRIIAHIKPDLVLGMGGFICGPGGIATRFLNIPLIIHEQNAIPGLTNKLLATSKFLRLSGVLEAFPGSFPKETQAIFTGNPVRKELTQFELPEKRWQNRSGRLKLLVLGGSLGAKAINQIVPNAIALMPANERPEIYHQTGESHLKLTQALYETYQIDGNIVSFIDDIAKAYLWADLVICRAGAITLAELCSVGIGSILVPFPHAVDDHQTKNAEYLSKADAAILMPQINLTAENLAPLLKNFSANRTKLIEMATNAYALRAFDATQKVVALLTKSLG